MKHKKTVRVPAETREVVDHLTCDLCQCEIKPARFEVSQVEVSLRTGSCFPEGGSGEVKEYDICQSCFESKLMIWLSSQGAEPQTREWES